jgi:hypothetical protein
VKAYTGAVVTGFVSKVGTIATGRFAVKRVASPRARRI